MQSKALSIEQYLTELPPERQGPVRALHEQLLRHLPQGFEARMQYGMVGYVVPHRLYPAGYHCDPKQPLPFMGLASQKASINLYHMGLYTDDALLAWFQAAHAKASAVKLDMGKSCIRYKKPEHIPLALLGQLAAQWTPAQWIAVYEAKLKKT